MIMIIILDLPSQWGPSAAPVAVTVPAAEKNPWQPGWTNSRQQKILNCQEIWFLYIRSFINIIKLFLNILGLNLVKKLLAVIDFKHTFTTSEDKNSIWQYFQQIKCSFFTKLCAFLEKCFVSPIPLALYNLSPLHSSCSFVFN